MNTYSHIDEIANTSRRQEKYWIAFSLSQVKKSSKQIYLKIISKAILHIYVSTLNQKTVFYQNFAP